MGKGYNVLDVFKSTKIVYFSLKFYVCSVRHSGKKKVKNLRAENLLIRSSLISLKSNEQLWGIHSDRSFPLSDLCYSLTVAQRKWANERFAQNILAKKILNLVFSMFYIQLKKKKKFEKLANR